MSFKLYTQPQYRVYAHRMEWTTKHKLPAHSANPCQHKSNEKKYNDGTHRTATQMKKKMEKNRKMRTAQITQNEDKRIENYRVRKQIEKIEINVCYSFRMIQFRCSE